MGGDGGSLPARSVMVKTKGYGLSRNDSIGGMGYGANHMGRQEEETIDNKRIKQMRMQYCTLSHVLLYKKPVVVCRKGYMYSKEALYTALLDKGGSNKKKKKNNESDILPKHIKKIKDVRTANIEWIDDEDMSKDRHCTFRCPVTRKDLDDGSTSVIMLWPCGCVMDKQCIIHQQHQQQQATATTTIDKNKYTCMNCGAPYDPSKGDVITLAPATTVMISNDKDHMHQSSHKGCYYDVHSKKRRKMIHDDSSSNNECKIEVEEEEEEEEEEQEGTAAATITKRTYDERKEYINDAMDKLRRSAVYHSIFGSSNDNNKRDTDAFGRGF